MFGIFLIRVLRAAFQNFWRNIWLSIATTAIMTITLLLMSFLYFANVIGVELVRNIERKVDLSVTFNDSATEEQIRAVANEIGSKNNVEEVRLVSSEEALEQFRRRHADDPFIEESLRELEDNPLPSSMFIVANDPRFYQQIASELESERFAPFIEEINFENSRTVIDRLISVMSTVKNVGFAATLVFAVLVVLIMFNTIRLAIYSFREEIDIMRLVGASRWFIQGPFLFEAVLVALLAVVLASVVLYPSLSAFSPQLQRFFFDTPDSEFNAYQYALTNWTTIIGLQALLAVGLAMFSSMIAIRRYLR